MQDFTMLPELHDHLFRWWLRAGRVLPWRMKRKKPQLSSEASSNSPQQQLTVRDTAFIEYMTQELRRDPYRVVVAEVMLQQTQVDRVIEKYQGWMSRWPTTQELAKSELAEVLIFWQGLGYNRRARFLWLLAKEIEERSGVWPETESELLKLPGVGKYTARAILSFAFGKHTAVVDTNVKRVLRRLIDGKEASELPNITELEWFAWADRVLPAGKADPWNQLIMDFGALVCTAKAPKCLNCPAKDLCQAQHKAQGAGFLSYREYLLAQSTPVRKKKIAQRFEDSDRYFRGRIVDQLRQGRVEMTQLRQVLATEFGLVDELRFAQLIEGLLREGMISKQDQIVSLG
jgi:A/G-specific adenine glycosylase